MMITFTVQFRNGYIDHATVDGIGYLFTVRGLKPGVNPFLYLLSNTGVGVQKRQLNLPTNAGPPPTENHRSSRIGQF